MGSTANAHNVCVSRNKGVTKLLGHDEFTHIMFVDNDVTIPDDAIGRLMSLDANVATGCVPTTVRDVPFIAVAQSVEPVTNAITWQRHWFSGARETEACGAACLLIRREVFGAIGFPWFRWPEYYVDARYYYHSEDIDFCNRVMADGLGPIMAHGDVRCGHQRNIDTSTLIRDETDVSH